MRRWAPLGYDIKDRKLVINAREAPHVRFMFERFARLGSVTKLLPILAAEGIKAKSGKPVEKGYLYRIITNPVYVGEARHKGTSYPGEHKAIVDRKLWDRVQGILKESPRKRAANSRARTPALLKGLIFGPSGTAMTPSHTRRNGKLYRYYVDMDVLKRGAEPGAASRIAAGDLERAVVDQLRAILRTPEIVVRTWRKIRPKIDTISEAEVREALEQLDPLWDELFPAEQARIVQLLVERVDARRMDSRSGSASMGSPALPKNSTAKRGRMSASAKLTRAGRTLVVRIPLPVQRRGTRKLVVGPDGAPWGGPRVVVDNTIVKALARAHRWKTMLESGEYASPTELAKSEKINFSYLCRVLRLTLLAPDIVEALLDRKQQRLQLSDLLRPIPLIWTEQRDKLERTA